MDTTLQETQLQNATHVFQSRSRQGRRPVMELGVDVFVNIRHCVELGGRAGPLHDHSWRIEVVCRARGEAVEEGVLVEFAVVRERVQAIARAWDGQVLNDLPAFRDIQPTVENAVLKFQREVRRSLAGLPVRLSSVTVWENPTHFVRLSEV